MVEISLILKESSLKQVDDIVFEYVHRYENQNQNIKFLLNDKKTFIYNNSILAKHCYLVKLVKIHNISKKIYKAIGDA